MSKIYLLSFLTLLLFGCSGLEDTQKQKLREQNAVGERISRTAEDQYCPTKERHHYVRSAYPWETIEVDGLCRITKEFFRCKGSVQNTPKTKEVNGEKTYTFDCGGKHQHSLPIRDGKEEVYPALFDLLNYIQEKTKKKVEITCGHRCPTHNTYSDPSVYNQTSKHMIGAEVDFYVVGLEWRPQVIIQLLQKYYQEHSQFGGDPSFTQFKRFEGKVNVSTLPWHNKEIFVKLYTKDEGRDLDNDHPYPYFSIQLKWDRDRNEPVSYSWAKAFNEYLRY